MTKLKIYNITGAADITSWDSTTYDSSGIKWDDGTKKWIAVNVEAAGGLSSVVEDDSPQLGGDLDGQSTYGIYDITYLSSQKVSGSISTGDLTINANTISGLIDPSYPSCATNKHYVDSEIGDTDFSGSIYVGKNGSDSNDGLSPHNAFLTVSKGLTEAASIASSSWPITVKVSNGTYTETALPVCSYVHLEGESRNGTIIQSTTAGEDPFIGVSSNSSIQNLTINAEGSGSIAIKAFTNVNDVYLDNLYIYAKKEGIGNENTIKSWRNSIINNVEIKVEPSGNQDSYGIHILSSGASLIDYEPLIIKNSFINLYRPTGNGSTIGIYRPGSSLGEDPRVDIINSYIRVISDISGQGAETTGIKKGGVGQSYLNNCTIYAKNNLGGTTRGLYFGGTMLSNHGITVNNSFVESYSPTGLAYGLYSKQSSDADVVIYANTYFKAEANKGTEYDIYEESTDSPPYCDIQYINCSFRPQNSYFSNRHQLNTKYRGITQLPVMDKSVWDNIPHNTGDMAIISGGSYDELIIYHISSTTEDADYYLEPSGTYLRKDTDDSTSHTLTVNSLDVVNDITPITDGNVNIGSAGIGGKRIKNIYLSGNLQYESTLYASAKDIVHSVVSSQSLRQLAFEEAELSSPASGEILVYKADNSRWENELPPMTFNIGNIEISANHNINLTRFDAGSKNVYVWQAAACNSGGTSVSGLCVELLSGSTSVYKTSSSILQQGYPLAKSDGGNTEIRFMYSGGASLSGYQYGTGFMQISVY